jgi:phenylacetate-CoA ligase
VRPPHPLDDRLAQRLWRALRLYPRTVVDALAPSDEIAAALARLRPDVITGYPGVLDGVARALSARGDGAPRPRLIVAGGEVLTPAARERIGRAFGTTVREIYGSHECPLIAWECGRGHGLHVWDPGVVLEVVRDGRAAFPGESGEVVLTALHSFAMPFIRYVLGDVVVAGETPCPCGAPSPRSGPSRGGCSTPSRWRTAARCIPTRWSWPRSRPRETGSRSTGCCRNRPGAWC